MSGFPIVDLVVGMIFIYFLLAIINNSLIELVASLTRLRAYYLKLWLKRMFPAVINAGHYKGQKFYFVIMNHCLLNNLSAEDKTTSYFSPADFSTAIIEIITSDQLETPDSLVKIESSIRGTTILSDALKNIFLMYCANAKHINSEGNNTVTDIDQLKTQIEQWFKNSMNRVGGLFKKHTLLFTFIFATVLSFGLNLDSIVLMKYLYSNPQARQQIANSATKNANDSDLAVRFQNASHPIGKDSLLDMSYTLDSLKNDYIKKQSDIISAYSDLNASMLPIGWTGAEYNLYLSQNKVNDSNETKIKYAGLKIAGLLITILAISLGAPFWFDLLSQVANIRSTIKPS